MDVGDFLAVLRKRWIVATVIALGTLAATAVLTLASTPTYTATTSVFFSVQGGATVSDLVQGSTYAEKQVQSYAEVATSPLVLQPVIDDLGLDVSPQSLASTVTATIPLNTVIIEISAVNESPQQAANIANAVAAELAEAVAALAPADTAGTEAVRATIIAEATVPAGASSPNVTRNLGLGLVLGVGLGIGLALLREVLDSKVRTESDVARVTEASIVATIGYDGDASAHPLTVQADPHSPRAEAYRRLRTNLQFLDIADRSHSIVITSSLPGEGKSTTSINLAIALAEAGTRVLLVDADLRRPQVAKYLQLEGRVGLTTVLIGRADLPSVVQPWGNGNLHVLPSGRVPPNPSELLGSHAMESLMEVATEQYDMVILDSPPLLPVTDSAILAGKAGGALVVVGSDNVHMAQLEDSLEALEAVDARVLGLVLNKIQRKHIGKYHGYHYGSSYAPQMERTTRPRPRRRGSSAPKVPSGEPVAKARSLRQAADHPQSVTTGVGERTSGASRPEDPPPSIQPRRTRDSGGSRST
ncbi:polysaccharide biosynthesis tyrosine autokinase [Occultella kanbiaonis]|uniref:polysaccharide biosynthesis tyrosine autokinase n=1 Tax=Occultella kanbiaonis TaxID=2675754 RepID=UPI0013D1F60B|nr:polysaccharide biosynthesis tyrosine autokinase [Occultella kanbiaonis]